MTTDMTFVRVCAAREVARGTVVGIRVEDTPVAVVHCTDGTFRAVLDECSHEEVPLSEGEVDGCTLECWLHSSRFDLATGEPVGPPAFEPVPVYPVEVRDGDVYVSLVPSNGAQP